MRLFLLVAITTLFAAPPFPGQQLLQSVLIPGDPSNHWFLEALRRNPKLADEKETEKLATQASQVLMDKELNALAALDPACDRKQASDIAKLIKKADYGAIFDLLNHQIPPAPTTQEQRDADWTMEVAARLHVARWLDRQNGSLSKTDLTMIVDQLWPKLGGTPGIKAEDFYSYQREQITLRILALRNAAGKISGATDPSSTQEQINAFETTAMETTKKYAASNPLKTNAIGVIHDLLGANPKSKKAQPELTVDQLFAMRMIQAAQTKGLSLTACKREANAAAADAPKATTNPSH